MGVDGFEDATVAGFLQESSGGLHAGKRGTGKSLLGNHGKAVIVPPRLWKNPQRTKKPPPKSRSRRRRGCGRI